MSSEPLWHGVILLIAAAAAPVAVSPQAVLLLGASVEDELRAGASRSYQLYLPKQHYAHVVAPLLEVRPATPRDRRLVAAQAVFSEGRQTYSKDTKEAFAAAIEKYLAALAIYREIDEPVGIRSSCFNSGKLLKAHGAAG